MTALLPASHHLRLNELQELLGREVQLATEEEFAALFDDCDTGAVPALALQLHFDLTSESMSNHDSEDMNDGCVNGDHT